MIEKEKASSATIYMAPRMLQNTLANAVAELQSEDTCVKRSYQLKYDVVYPRNLRFILIQIRSLLVVEKRIEEVSQ